MSRKTNKGRGRGDQLKEVLLPMTFEQRVRFMIGWARARHNHLKALADKRKAKK